MLNFNSASTQSQNEPFGTLKHPKQRIWEICVSSLHGKISLQPIMQEQATTVRGPLAPLAAIVGDFSLYSPLLVVDRANAPSTGEGGVENCLNAPSTGGGQR